MKLKSHLRISIGLTIAALAVLAPAQVRFAHLERAKEAIQTYKQKAGVSGVSVALLKNGHFLYRDGAGWADYDKKKAANANTIYRLASVSKAIASILALELADQNKLNLSAQTRSYLPDLKGWHTHDVYQLMANLSGVRHYKTNDPVNNQNKQYNSMNDARKLFQNDPLENIPGRAYLYSTHAYTLLAAVMEKATKQNYPNYALSRFRAWGINSLAPEYRNIKRDQRSELYSLQANGKITHQTPDNISWKYPGGGFEASAPDLCTLGWNLLQGKILKTSTRNSMWTSKKTSDMKETGYGYGWNVSTDSGRKVVAKNGAQTGSKSYWRVYPDDGVVVAVLSNTRAGDPKQLAVYLANLALAAPGGKALPFNYVEGD